MIDFIDLFRSRSIGFQSPFHFIKISNWFRQQTRWGHLGSLYLFEAFGIRSLRRRVSTQILICYFILSRTRLCSSILHENSKYGTVFGSWAWHFGKVSGLRRYLILVICSRSWIALISSLVTPDDLLIKLNWLTTSKSASSMLQERTGQLLDEWSR